MIRFFHFFFKKLRLSNPWNYKVPLLISFPYLWISLGRVELADSLLYVALSFCTILGIAGFGYLTNDLGDRSQDRLINKENATTNLSNGKILALFILFLLMALMPWFLFPKVNVSFYLLASELVLFTMYAFPPFRLKERGWLGVLADALYAHVVPSVLASLTFFLMGTEEYSFFRIFICFLVCWQILLGIRNILLHQLKDVFDDHIAGVSTVVTSYGQKKIGSMIRNVILPLEFITFIGFVGFLTPQLYLLLPGYVIFVLLKFFISEFRYSRDFRENAYELLDHFYLRWFPSLLLLSLMVIDLRFIVLLLAHSVLFETPFPQLISWVTLRLKRKFRN